MGQARQRKKLLGDQYGKVSNHWHDRGTHKSSEHDRRISGSSLPWESKQRKNERDPQANLIAQLESQGYQVTIVEAPHDQETAKLIAAVEREIKEEYHRDVAAAKAISESKALEIKRNIKFGTATEKERLQLARYRLVKFYDKTDITPDDVAFDRNGKTRSILLRGEAGLLIELANKRDREILQELAANGGIVLPNDLPKNMATNHAFCALGLEELLLKLLEGHTYSQYDPLIQEIADRALDDPFYVKELFGFTPTDQMTPAGIVGRFIAKIGFKSKLVGHLPDPETGRRTRHYSLDWEHFKRVAEIMRRRHDRRVKKGFKGATSHLFNLILEGRPPDPVTSLLNSQ